jgi:hypothetical protein
MATAETTGFLRRRNEQEERERLEYGYGHDAGQYYGCCTVRWRNCQVEEGKKEVIYHIKVDL